MKKNIYFILFFVLVAFLVGRIVLKKQAEKVVEDGVGPEYSYSLKKADRPKSLTGESYSSEQKEKDPLDYSLENAAQTQGELMPNSARTLAAASVSAQEDTSTLKDPSALIVNNNEMQSPPIPQAPLSAQAVAPTPEHATVPAVSPQPSLSEISYLAIDAQMQAVLNAQVYKEDAGNLFETFKTYQGVKAVEFTQSTLIVDFEDGSTKFWALPALQAKNMAK